MITIRLATQADALHVAHNLRYGDKLDLEAVGLEPVKAAIDSLHATPNCLAFEVDGVPIAIGGVTASDMPSVGVIWLLGTDDIQKNALAFCEATQVVIAHYHKEFPVLTNMIRSDNRPFIRWLKWLGFKLGEPFEMNGKLFYPHTRTCHV